MSKNVDKNIIIFLSIIIDVVVGVIVANQLLLFLFVIYRNYDIILIY